MKTFLLLLALALPAAAQLRWEALTLEIDVPAGAQRVPLRFAYTNAGAEPVTITEVRPSCGCVLAPDVTPRVVAPGESGVLEGVFEPGERSGDYATTLVVATTGPGPRHTVLSAQFRIPVVVDLNPRLYLWRLGEPAETRRGALTLRREAGLRFARLEGAQDRFRVELGEPAEDGSFAVSVTPLQVAGMAQGTFRIIFENDRGEPVRLTFYAMVR